MASIATIDDIKFNKVNAWCCTWNRVLPATGTNWEQSGWMAAQQKEIWGAGRQQAQHEPAACPGSPAGCH